MPTAGTLSLAAAALKRRHTAVKNVRGWYKTIDRVTHSLTQKRKLYIADIKNVLEPVLDCGETYPHHNLYFVASDVWDLEVLGGLLLSAIGQFFVESYGVSARGRFRRGTFFSSASAPRIITAIKKADLDLAAV